MKKPYALNKGLSFMLLLAFASACASTDSADVPKADQRRQLQGSQVSPPIGLLLAGMDANSDATLTSDELHDGFETVFAIGDKDDNEILTATEFTRWSEIFLGQTYTMPSLMNFDHNQNASISREEFDITLDEIVTRFDRNADGVLVRAELLMTLNIPALDPDKMRREMEAEMRKKMEETMRRRRGGAG